MEKSISNEAQVVEIIRAKIKELGVDGKVQANTDTYFGSEVNVQLTNLHPRDIDELKLLADKHTKGSHNSADGECYIFDYPKMQTENLPLVLYVNFRLLYTSEYHQQALEAITKAHELGDMVVEFMPTRIYIKNLMSSDTESRHGTTLSNN